MFGHVVWCVSVRVCLSTLCGECVVCVRVCLGMLCGVCVCLCVFGHVVWCVCAVYSTYVCAHAVSVLFTLYVQHSGCNRSAQSDFL